MKYLWLTFCVIFWLWGAYDFAGDIAEAFKKKKLSLTEVSKTWLVVNGCLLFLISLIFWCFG